MKVTIDENPTYQETEIIIHCHQTDPRILRLAAQLGMVERKITGLRDGQTFLLNTSDILYIDTVDRKTFLYGMTQVYETPLRLYELEEQLSSDDFFRATKSSIINFAKIKSLRPDFGGRLIVTLVNSEKMIVSRQYVSIIKQKLDIKMKEHL